MSGRNASLPVRLRDSLATLAGSGPVLVAVSGGLDSCVLLHLARFSARDAGLRCFAAHFDHGMRESSADDALWVAGLCRAWEVPLHVGRAESRLTSEEEARIARYQFLEEVRRETGSALVLTAHHADDQAETVLFRLLRGTGPRGLGGIPARRSPAIARPLLDFWRAELRDYALGVRLSWREDPSNADHAFARNAVRNRLLPEAERLVAPGARRALVRLALVAREDEAAWESVLPLVLAPLDVAEVEGGVAFDRARMLELHPALRARVLRTLAAGLGVSLDHVATRLAVEFAASGSSGRAIDLGGSISLGVELDRCILARPGTVTEDRPLAIRDAGPGRGDVVLAGTSLPVSWGDAEVHERMRSEKFELEGLHFPLVVRSRRPGDRIRLPGGTKKVKKVFLEGRIPPSERHRVPLVVDAQGHVLWIPGVARAESSDREVLSDGLQIGIG